MLGGLLLIAAGVGLLLTARSYFQVADSVNKRSAHLSREDSPSLVTRTFHGVNAKWGARSTLWFGVLLGVAAIGVGVVLLFQG